MHDNTTLNSDPMMIIKAHIYQTHLEGDTTNISTKSQTWRSFILSRTLLLIIFLSQNYLKYYFIHQLFHKQVLIFNNCRFLWLYSEWKYFRNNIMFYNCHAIVVLNFITSKRITKFISKPIRKFISKHNKISQLITNLF